MAINFEQIGAFKGTSSNPNLIDNPTSIAFGPDGRLYVAEQNGSINAFEINFQQDGSVIAAQHEELTLSNGGGVVKSIMNHNDKGTNQPSVGDRQVTGLLVTGTAENPILYISSSDPRIAYDTDSGLDTNSGIITRVIKTGNTWEAVDILRGLPRSEENHSVNGMVLSTDGTKLYLAVGGNTNNGAPSKYFAYTGEYSLSGTILEIDLVDINSRPVLTDGDAGHLGTTAVSRQYIYDLPTLDDPNVPNVTGGGGEDANGIDENGPFGGNDGLNMAILPADAPLRIYADGFRNPYDLVLRADGKLYTQENGSNGSLGGDPVIVNGEATNTPVNGGIGDNEPLFLVEDGGYYGHANPARSNQNLAWTVYNDSGTPDISLLFNTVSNLSALVPASVQIQDGYLIDPSKFTSDPTRLKQSGIRVPYNSSQSNAIVTIGSSANGLMEYTSDAFDGALQGALLVAQFNNNVTLLNLNDAGTGLEPLIDPGPDARLGTLDDFFLDVDGVYPLLPGLSTPLDVTIGPNGTIWVAEIGGDFIKVYAPSPDSQPDNTDWDKDGILNISDPFIRDASNGKEAILFPGQTLVWDFDPNQDNNLPGENGYGGGLTGVMLNGSTDYELFFNEPYTLDDASGNANLINLDNVKFITAAGGGTTVIENVAIGTPLTTSNNGEYLFHTGVTIAPSIETFKIKWTVVNTLTGPSQQIGGYIGTGDQKNYLKIVAIKSNSGEIQVLLENDDIVTTSYFIQADNLFTVPPDQGIFFELEINPAAATATPTITYQTGNGNTENVSGASIDLTGTKVLDTILGNYQVQGKTTGLALGLLSSNTGQSPTNTFQAIFTDLEIKSTGSFFSTVLYRVNAGGPTISAIDGGPNWVTDISSTFLVNSGSNSFGTLPLTTLNSSVPLSTPGAVLNTARWDSVGGSEMQYAFAVNPGIYEVRIYGGNGYVGTSLPGQRVFDVAIEGSVPSTFNNVDLSEQFGNLVGGMISNTVSVTDGTLNIEFLHGIENPLVNGIEILQISTIKLISIAATTQAAEPDINGLFTVSLSSAATTDTVITYTVSGSATAGVGKDYATLSGTVTILANQLSATIPVAVLDDSAIEGTESVIVTLTGVSGSDAVLGFTKTATVNISDNEVASSTVLYRVNAGGPTISAIDGGPNWITDISSTFLVNPGSNSFGTYPLTTLNSSVPLSTPGAVLNTARWDSVGGSEMQYAFAANPGIYEVRIYGGNGYVGTSLPGQRVFDVTIEGSVPSTFNDVDLSKQFGNLVGGMISNTVSVTDGTLNIEFLHGVENPLVNGIEIIQLATSKVVSIAATTQTAEPNINGLFTVNLSSVATTDTVITYTVGGTATAGVGKDYATLSGTVTILANQLSATIPVAVLDDSAIEGTESVIVTLTGVSGSDAILGSTKTATVNISDNEVGGQIGEAVLKITPDSNNVQISNFGANSFQITNTGNKTIAQVDIDVTNALYPDSVFDPFGLAGDSTSKPLTIDTNGNTGIIAPSNASYIGIGGAAGYKGLRLTFDSNVNGGFQSGETIGFAIDMDPNSVAGTQKAPLDAGSSPTWDVGGVSGAELIGSSFKVTFTDGTTATGQLQGNNNQGGAQGLASQDFPNLPVSLTVNGLTAGKVGTYDSSGISVIVNGSAGKTARVVLTKGFIQPVTPYNQALAVQLATLAAKDFPANNSVEFQTVDVLLTGGNQDISSQFNLSGVPIYNFAGEDKLALGFVASVIDPTSSNLPIGPVTQPIYLEFNGGQSIAPVRLEAETADAIVNYRSEVIGVASGGQVLSFVGGVGNESGSATFIFGDQPDELTGSYNLVIGTFDENDGLASFTLQLKDFETNTTTQIGSLLLNDNLGSNVANAQTFISPTAVSGISLTAGDQLIINGFENESEHARLDFIQLNRVI